MPGRVVLQDFTGVPVAVDIAAMRDAVATLGGDASIINISAGPPGAPGCAEGLTYACSLMFLCSCFP